MVGGAGMSADGPGVRIERAEGAVTVALGGRWRLSEGVPDHAALADALSWASGSRIVLRDAGVTEWDGALVAWAFFF